ncbi:hypothetical protein BLS_007695 [Venturia inaequalis]|uniref:Zn(2)-C6 fungal-type domain-containing protein n=1 Tax=Venturia inaequalis TaxID=5025 RepID=A0A8H3UN53_VENIN|nr:hypothetical protein BLS_007695 [Venturia inaequalis]KAE9972198.1 hypothetical protein EG327_009569 [Venturia inaequalis]KAE9980346.1 hypothetical protein EG328_000374 [Venturia inaequalis]
MTDKADIFVRTTTILGNEMASPASNHQSESPEPAGSASGQKRKRRTFACYDCRRRKLRCDRSFPVCGRCRASGNALTCVYDTAPAGYTGENGSAIGGQLGPPASQRPRYDDSAYQSGFPSSHQSVPQEDAYSIIQRQAERIATLEARLARSEPVSSSFEYRNGQSEVINNPKPLSGRFDDHLLSDMEENRRPPDTVAIGGEDAFVFRGKGFKTQFYGPSSPMSAVLNSHLILKFYPEFKIYLSDPTVRSGALSKVRQEAESIRKRVRTKKKLAPISPVISLFGHFPSKETVDQHVELYWDLMENTYRVLHQPTFISQYQAFWQNPNNTKESFTAIILLILSIVRCLGPQSPAHNTYHGLSSTGREQAMEWIDACESWLNRQSRKHLTIEAFQIRILLYIAKQTNCIKSKQLWENATALLNFGLATGLHQDPTKIDKILVNEKPGSGPHKQQNSAYEREMRRRIWATMVELELQVSFDRGLPSSRTVLIADCGVPSNLSDEEFGSDSPSLPGPETRETFTASSYLRLSNESLQLRVTLNDLINNTSARLSYDDLLSYDERITKALESLPKWVHSALDSGNVAMVPAVLLDIQLRQFQLSLHIPFARRVGTSPRYKYSKMMCVNNANRILELHLKLAGSGLHTLNVLRDDVFRASMAMCHNMVLWGSLKSDIFMQSLGQHYSNKVEQGITLLEEKIFRLGEHYGQLWFLVSGYGMLESAFAPHDLSVHVQGMVDRLTKLFHKVISAQEVTLNEHTAAGALASLAGPTGNLLTTPDMQMQSMGNVPMDNFPMQGADLNWSQLDDIWPFTGTGLSW